MINNNELIDQIKSYNRFLNSDSLTKAYNFALEAHQNQKRDEGVPYIIHPIAGDKIKSNSPISFLIFSDSETQILFALSGLLIN